LQARFSICSLHSHIDPFRAVPSSINDDHVAPIP
jgi:hypothetical protein